jgi:pimeloyl-ACP methyl ester carboxylesterase
VSRRAFTIVASAATGAGLVAYLAVLLPFQTFKRRALHDLAAGSSIAVTAHGLVEYAIDGAGPTVLVLPGSFGGYDQAGLIGRDLRTRGFRTLAVSRPGYLRTPIAVGRTPREQAEAFAVLLDSLAVGRVAVLAASGGGPAAIELAAAHPDKVWALVLISALTGSKVQAPGPAPAGTALTDALLGEGFSTWRLLRALERSGVAALESPIFSPATRTELVTHPEKLASYFALAWFRFPPERRMDGYLNDRAAFGEFAFDRFEAIIAPTLVIHGSDDLNVSVDHAQRASTRIPDAELVRLEGADHFLSIAFPEKVWPRVAGFLARHAPASQP